MLSLHPDNNKTNVRVFGAAVVTIGHVRTAVAVAFVAAVVVGAVVAGHVSFINVGRLLIANSSCRKKQSFKKVMFYE